MKKVFKGFIYFILVCILGVNSLNTFAQALNNKVDKGLIEKVVRDKIDRGIGSIVKADQYIVDIKIDVNVIEPPKKQKIKFNDSEKVQAEEDYILFNKLGFEAPVDAELDELIEAPKESKEELKSIEIVVFFDKTLKKNKVDSAKKILNALNFNFLVKPSFKFEEIDYAKEKIKVKKPGIMDHLKTFNLPLGLFLSSLVLGLMLLLGLGKMSKSVTTASDAVTGAVAASAEAAGAGGDAGAGAGGDAGAGGEGGGGSGGGGTLDGELQGGDLTVATDDQIKSTMLRFKESFKENPISISALVKNWLKIMPKGAREGLILLAKELESEDLLELFKQLKINDRKEWQKVIGSSTGMEDFNVGRNFLDSQILQDIIVPNDLVDDETKQMLASMAPVNLAKMINENPAIGPLLMNTLSTVFIN